MDFKKLANKAKETIDKRGGVASLKADAGELKKVAQRALVRRQVVVPDA